MRDYPVLRRRVKHFGGPEKYLRHLLVKLIEGDKDYSLYKHLIQYVLRVYPHTKAYYDKLLVLK